MEGKFEESKIKVKVLTEKYQWRELNAENLTCKDFYRTIHYREITSKTTSQKFLEWEKQIGKQNWSKIFTNLRKHINQRHAFDIW